jgi:hypothetical protein
VVDLPLFVLWSPPSPPLIRSGSPSRSGSTGIIGHLNGLSGSLASGRVADLRALPAGNGWGVLSQITADPGPPVYHRQAARAAEEPHRPRAARDDARVA